MKLFKILALALLLSSCTSTYLKYDYEKTTNFKDYKTYNFFKDIESGLNSLDEKRLRSAIEMELNTMGLKKSENASFLIDFKSEEFEENSSNTVGVGLGRGVVLGVPVGPAKINRRIVIEFFDESSVGLFWQAISETRLRPNENPEKREANFKAIVAKMMKDYASKI